MMVFVKSNIKVLVILLSMVVAGTATMSFVSLNYDTLQLSTVTWLFIQSLSLYIAYLCFQSIFFDRFIACFKIKGNVGFFIVTIDFIGYTGTVLVLMFKEFFNTDINWLDFYNQMSGYVGIICTVAFSCSIVYLVQRHKKEEQMCIRDSLYTMSMAVPRQNGEKNDLLMLELYENCPDFLDIYDFDLLDAKQTFHLLLRTSVPVIINESFIRYLVPEGEDPVGQPISKYVPEKSEKGTIIGVMKDFKKYSLTNNVFPLRMILHEMPQDNYTTLTLQFDEQDRTTVINHLRGLWEKKYPDVYKRQTIRLANPQSIAENTIQSFKVVNVVEDNGLQDPKVDCYFSYEIMTYDALSVQGYLSPKATMETVSYTHLRHQAFHKLSIIGTEKKMERKV